METMLVQVWYPMTVATQPREQKKVILDNLIKTGTDLADMDPFVRMLNVAYSLVDFGCRGVSSMETAAIGGAAHLVNFAASDTMPGLCMTLEYHSHDHAAIIGTSVPAAEHSTNY